MFRLNIYMIVVVCATWTRKINLFNLLEIILLMIFCALTMSCLVILRLCHGVTLRKVWDSVLIQCLLKNWSRNKDNHGIMHECLLELVLTNTCVNSYWVFLLFVFFKYMPYVYPYAQVNPMQWQEWTVWILNSESTIL